MHSGKWKFSLGDRPAPETPLLASMMIPVRSIRSSAIKGARAKDAGRGVTARVGDELGRGNLVAEELGQAVHGLLQAGEVGVLVAVPVGVDLGIAQAIVGAQIDDPDVPLAEGRNVTARLAVCGKARKANDGPLGDPDRRRTVRRPGRSAGSGWDEARPAGAPHPAARSPR